VVFVLEVERVLAHSLAVVGDEDHQRVVP